MTLWSHTYNLFSCISFCHFLHVNILIFQIDSKNKCFFNQILLLLCNCLESVWCTITLKWNIINVCLHCIPYIFFRILTLSKVIVPIWILLLIRVFFNCYLILNFWLLKLLCSFILSKSNCLTWVCSFDIGVLVDCVSPWNLIYFSSNLIRECCVYKLVVKIITLFHILKRKFLGWLKWFGNLTLSVIYFCFDYLVRCIFTINCFNLELFWSGFNFFRVIAFSRVNACIVNSKSSFSWLLNRIIIYSILPIFINSYLNRRPVVIDKINLIHLCPSLNILNCMICVTLHFAELLFVLSLLPFMWKRRSSAIYTFLISWDIMKTLVNRFSH